MGFDFGIVGAIAKTSKHLEGYSTDFLHKHECQICPLNRSPGLINPKIEPQGSTEPLVYMLGEAPNTTSDERNKPFAGEDAELLHWRIPSEWKNKLRWNNVIRCHPPKDRNPTRIEMECCRPSVESDIANTKPDAIFGFGNVPLQWLLDEGDALKWRGRRVPVNVGGHKCWFFPMLHPSYVLHRERYRPRTLDRYGSEYEFAFALDLRKAFEAVQKGLPTPVIHTKDFATRDVDIISTPDEAINAIHRMWNAKIAGFDYETGSLRPFVEDPKILSFALSSKDLTFACPMEHRENTWSEKEIERVFDALSKFLYEADTRKTVHNLAFEQEWSAYYFGADCLRATRWDCTQSQGYHLYGKRGSDYDMGALSLDFLCKQHFGIGIKALSHVNRKNLSDEPLERILPYNGIDARYHRLLFAAQNRELQEAGLSEVYEEHLRRIPTMVLTQIRGVPVDQNQTLALKRKFENQLTRVEHDLADLKPVKEFKRQKGADYRPAATQDVTFMYRKILRAPIERTDEKTITDVMGGHPVTKLTLRWRKLRKKLSTYVLPMVQGGEDSSVFPDGLLHPVFLLTTTDTWRTGCQEPNIQNWPKHQEGVLEIRKQIAAKRRYRIVSFDYAGIQARNVAMESFDEKLIDAYWNDYDIHADWRDRIAQIYPRWIPDGIKSLSDPKVAKQYRQKAKNEFVFATFFGAHPPTLTRHLGIPVEVTERLRNDFMREFRGIDAWHKGLAESFNTNGYVTGKTGHRRYAPISPNQLINAPIQADEASIVCDAMTRLSELEDDRFQAILEVHDDLTFCWPAEQVEKNSEVVIDHMLRVPFKWARVVPIGVERSIGQDWGDMHEDGEVYSSKTWKGGLWQRPKGI